MMFVLRRRFWERVLASSPRRLAQVGYNFFRYRADLRPLREALPESALGRLLESRPEVWGMVATPYLCARWTASERIARVTDHCATIERLGPLLDTPLDTFVDLVDLHQIDPSYRIVLDQPHWFIRDGLATFSLWEGKDRLISLSYCLSSDGGGLTAYIGGLQGRSEDVVLDRYRRFTKKAEGMRPTDFTVELFRAFCRGLGVTRILAVSDATQHLRSPYFTRQQTAPSTHLNYDALWQDRGGDLQPNGFYELSLNEPRREPDAIQAKKRAMYRRRYAMLDAITTRIDEITRDGRAPAGTGRYTATVSNQAGHAELGLNNALRSYSAERQSPLLSR